MGCLYDAHGNMIAAVNSNGVMSAQRVFDPWGVIRTANASGDPTGRYCANLGHKQDDESGLVYMRARYYEPASGRFLSEDSAMQGKNWCIYCGSNPVNGHDETGKWTTEDTYYALGFALWRIGLSLGAAGLWLYFRGAQKIAAAEALLAWTGNFLGAPVLAAASAQTTTGAALAVLGASLCWLARLFDSLGEDAEEYVKTDLEVVDNLKDLVGG